MDKKITIGIRTYNVAHYIESCLNSVYNQSIRDDVKIVLVDDCSTDETLIILDKWLDDHENFDIEIYTNRQNQGAGVMLMQLQHYIKNTEYVIFLDGDDFYTKNDCLEYMYNFINNHKFDFVRFTNKPEDHHTKTLMNYEIFKKIKFNSFRVLEDHYYWQLQQMTSNYVLHNYDFYYYRNNSNSLIRATGKCDPLSNVFDRVYYKGIPETVKQLKYITPTEEYQDVYNELLSVNYNINPAVLVLSKNTDLHEFIQHYRNLGFKEIFILDNNDCPVQYDNAYIIPYNNIPLVTFQEFQSTAYDHALRIIKQTKYNYLLVVDDDEYLQLKEHSTITDFIEEELVAKGYYNCDFQWETYDDNDIIYEKDMNDSIQTTYTRKLQKGKQDDFGNHKWTKCLYRITSDINYSRSANPGHNPSEEYYKKNVINKKIAVLKHYRTQCLETFLKSKVLQKNFQKGNFGMHGLLTSYFCINNCSIKKLEAYKSLCQQYNINYDEVEYQKYLNVCNNQNKLSIVIPVDKEEDVALVETIPFPDDCDVIMVSETQLNTSSKYTINCYEVNIYDGISHTIKALKSEYACVLLPTSKVYVNKFSKQLNFLKENQDVDIVTCNCLCNGKINIKPILSTIMFRVNSVQSLDLILEDYYQSYDKFFINARNLKIHNIDEVLQEESFVQTPCLYNVHNLFNQTVSKNFTVIITFQNEGVEIKKTVESIRSTTFGIPIILIDDFSTDGYDYEAIAETYNCKYIKNSENFGVAKSRDLGVSLCETDQFVILDGHMRFYDIDWDIKLTEILVNNPNSIVCSNTSEINYMENIGYISEQKFHSTARGSYIELQGYDMYNCKWSFNCLDESDVVRIACVMGACYASTKTHWNNIRGLQGLVKYGCDEQLMSIKTWLSGGECLLLKDFYSGHLYRHQAPYHMTKDHIVTNKIFLSYFFNYGIDQLKEYTDVLTYNRCLQMVDFEKINQLRLDFISNVQKYPFEYFININDQSQNYKTFKTC